MCLRGRPRGQRRPRGLHSAGYYHFALIHQRALYPVSRPQNSYFNYNQISMQKLLVAPARRLVKKQVIRNFKNFVISSNALGFKLHWQV